MALSTPRNWLNNLPLGLLRVLFNFWPPFFGAGVKVAKMSADYRFIEVVMPLRWYNKNYISSQFGGSMFSMTDPFYMLMLIKNLGDDYIVLDKGGSIDFKKIARSTVRATFCFTEEEINNIKKAADQNEKYVFDRSVDIIDSQEVVVASVIRTIYVRRKVVQK